MVTRPLVLSNCLQCFAGPLRDGDDVVVDAAVGPPRHHRRVQGRPAAAAAAGTGGHGEARKKEGSTELNSAVSEFCIWVGGD